MKTRRGLLTALGVLSTLWLACARREQPPAASPEPAPSGTIAPAATPSPTPTPATPADSPRPARPQAAQPAPVKGTIDPAATPSPTPIPTSAAPASAPEPARPPAGEPQATAAVAGKAAERPKTVTLPAKLGAVTFDHDRHASRPGVTCATCHHASKPVKPLTRERQACRECHTSPAKPPVKTSLQAAFHDPKAASGTCIDCHARSAAQGAPLKCMDCHKRK